jgi:hypothetical protein
MKTFQHFWKTSKSIKKKYETRRETVYWNCIRTKPTHVFSLLTVIGKPKKTWKIRENQSFLTKFGRLQKSYLTTKPKLGVWTN